MRTLDLGEAVGPGVPTGGTANQVLVKNGATNFDTSWKDASQLPAIGDEAAAREAADAALADGLAIIANGDTHAAVAAGKAVFVRSHSTLAPGLYWARSAIGANAALSTSNLTADASGGLNKLKADLDSLNSNLAPTIIYPMTKLGSSSSFELQAEITSYNKLFFMVTPDGNSARKGILTIPVSDVVTGGYTDNNQYVASVQEYSGGSWYVAFVQFYFSDSRHIVIVGKGVSGWTNNLAVKLLASK